MSAYVPQALTNCYNTIKAAIPKAELGGIYANKPGYHNSRNQCSSGDYSVQKPDDKTGDANAASGLDVTMRDPADMKRVTQRLIDATKAGDGRLLGLREFFGTVDGVTVTGMDVRGKYWVTSDPSHLWHVHLSFYRKYATNNQAAQDIAAVCIGSGSSGGSSGDGGTVGDDMPNLVRLTLSKKTPLKKGTAAVIQWDKAPSDPEGMWGGAGQPSGSYPAIKAAGKFYVSTLAVTFDALAADQSVALALDTVNTDNGEVSTGPREEKRGTSGTTAVVVSQAGKCGSKTKVQARVNATQDVNITSASWVFLYW